ncbi:MAG TPA: hypothetical protein VKZ72_03865 [Acidimicrobiales bacterium]|nr:hypothetical protein [Acidimicrobiales bacterium]
MSKTKARPDQVERVSPELAIARLDLRQLCLLAVNPVLTAAERQAVGAEHARAVAEGERVLDRYATATDLGVEEVARVFFGFYHAFPNLGLVGPFFDDAAELRETVLVAAYDSVLSGVDVRHELHARLWDRICDEDRRAEAVRCYIADRQLHSFPPSAGREAVERYRRRIDTLMATAECVPALLATWAIERHRDRLQDLAKAHVKDKHGLLELRAMARLMRMKPNTLTRALIRFRARLGEEMRLLWNIEKTDHEDDER